MNKNTFFRGSIVRAPLAGAIALALLSAPAAQAFEFENGGLTGSLDTTVSYGISVRAQDIDPNLIGKSHYNPLLCAYNIPLGAIPPGLGRCGSSAVPGSAEQLAAPGRWSNNRDDGDLKYDKGDAFSNAFKITSELSLKYGSWGAFTRATYFYDFDNTGRNDLTKEAQEKVGKDFRLLDAFVYHDFNLGEHQGSFRLGRQAVSWGESTFIQNGINVINPIDVSKLRVAGAELKEAFLPIDMAWASFSFTDNLSMEALYMFEFEEIEVDPAGTYFSSNDFATPGGTYVMLGFGTAPQPVNDPSLYAATCALPLGSGFGNTDTGLGALTALGCGNSVPRLPNRNAKDTGQYGLAMHYFAEGLGNTEFGLYALNYHSRLPLLSGRAVGPAALFGTPPGLAAGYFVEFPEDIRMYGLSWNTSLPGGIAWQGEVSHRPNAPLQLDDVELLFAALSPLNLYSPTLISQPSLRFCSQFKPNCGSYSLGEEIRGWEKHKVSQLQMTFTKAFASVLGAEQVSMVGEIGVTKADIPDASVMRFEGEGTDTGGGASVDDFTYVSVPGVGPVPLPALLFHLGPAGGLRNPQTLTEGFPTPISWGYRFAAKADYNSAFGTPLTLSPRFAYAHDVNGISPGPGGNFLEGRRSSTVGLEANYLNKMVFDLSYTAFFGGGGFNQISDRDFTSFSVKYSF